MKYIGLFFGVCALLVFIGAIHAIVDEYRATRREREAQAMRDMEAMLREGGGQ